MLTPPVSSSVSTDLVYYPRSRPAVPLPPRMVLSSGRPGIVESPEWRCFESKIPARTVGVTDIITKVPLAAASLSA